jgi:SagB-type dehydrogenase family enzyme
MRSRLCRAAAAATILFLLAPVLASAQELKPIQLPPARTDGGKPLMDVLKSRQSARVFAGDPLPLQTLSNLLWAAFGMSRGDGRRTAPSARNWQEIDIYVVLADGVYVYDAKAHALKPVASGDHRAQTGTQAYVATAPVNLVYVADLAKTGNAPAEEREIFTPADAGFIAENAYLFCTSEGLAVVVRGLIDRAALGKVLNLRADQKIILAQTIGLPKK